MNIETFMSGLAERINAGITDGHDQAISDFAAICRRHDENPGEQQRIRDFDTLMSLEDRQYDKACAAFDRGDMDVARALLSQLVPARRG